MNEEDSYQAPESEVIVAPSEGEVVLSGPVALSAGSGWTWILEALGLFGRSPWMWILIMVIYGVVTMAASFIPFVGSIALALFSFVLIAGLLIGCKTTDQGGALQMEHLFVAFNHERMAQLVLCGAILLGLSLVIGVIIGIGVAIFAGSAAFAANAEADLLAGGLSMITVLLGLIGVALALPLAMMTWFAPALIVFHKMQAWDAMKLSFQGCLKNIVPFLVYGLIMLVFMILAMIPFGLGLLVMMPVSVICMYTAYKMIFTPEQ